MAFAFVLGVEEVKKPAPESGNHEPGNRLAQVRKPRDQLNNNRNKNKSNKENDVTKERQGGEGGIRFHYVSLYT